MTKLRSEVVAAPATTRLQLLVDPVAVAATAVNSCGGPVHQELLVKAPTVETSLQMGL